ncbi:hypothetical protein BG004_001597, partial [Podila humilis]
AVEKLGVQTAEAFTYRDLQNDEAEDDKIADRVGMFTRLEMLLISNFINVGPRTVDTILALSDGLRVLELPNYGCIAAADVVLMLSSLKRLESFSVRNSTSLFRPDALTGRPRPQCTVFLSAADVLSIKWATKSLRIFSCPIQVYRLASHIPKRHWMADLTCEDEQECQTIQKQVLRRLAEQTNLTRLNFSITISVLTFAEQWYCLEMTQTSGLQELEKLSKLESLNISKMNHSMGPRDVQWVKDTWNDPQFTLRKN